MNLLRLVLSDTTTSVLTRAAKLRLNTPYGARCFLADRDGPCRQFRWNPVLMHRLALGAFWRVEYAQRVVGAEPES